MICARCGTENSPDSRYCKSCGSPLVDEPHPSSVGQPKTPTDQFSRGPWTAGSMYELGWVRTLGLVAPIIVAVIMMAAFLLAIFLVGVISSASDHPAFWNDLADFMADYFWLFFGLIAIGSFQGFLMHFHRQTFKWVNPFVSAIAVVAWLWILAQVLHLAAVDTSHPGLNTLSDLAVLVLPAVFVLAVIVGYMFVWFSLVSPSNWDNKT
jgi:hypothetical protein